VRNSRSVRPGFVSGVKVDETGIYRYSFRPQFLRSFCMLANPPPGLGSTSFVPCQSGLPTSTIGYRGLGWIGLRWMR
jgi:hypothetical protein